MARTPAPTLLANLKPRDIQASVCVRVIRKWNFTGRNENGPILHVDLVLADKEVWVYNISYLCLHFQYGVAAYGLTSELYVPTFLFAPCNTPFLVQNYCREVLCTLKFQEMKCRTKAPS